MKKIISSHIKKGNVIVSDGLRAYQWINRPFSGNIQSMHNHGHGLDSTIHIESLWSIEKLIKNTYNIIPHEDFILFLKESEFRRNTTHLRSQEKWNEFLEIIKYIDNRDSDELYSIQYLMEITEPL